MDTAQKPGLARELGLVGLTATGIASMVGAGINVIPFMIQRTVPGIGAWVLPAYVFAAVPAILAGLAYATLASAMPRAGGSYVYASRALSPYWGFIASFSQWFSLCVAIGVVSYLLVPFMRDAAAAAGLAHAAALLDRGALRVVIPLLVLWLFAGVNLLGAKSYQRLLVPLLGLTFILGGVVVVAGFAHDQSDFAAALARCCAPVDPALFARAGEGATPTLRTFLVASTLLFSSFIGFDSIAQAGGEAKDPGRTLPLAIFLSIAISGSFYLLFTSAVYHAVPWRYVAAEAARHDVTAPGLLGLLLPRGWTAAIVAGAALALAKDLPAMLLGVSRLMFAWAEDGIFPRRIAAIHPRFHTPHLAILASTAMATLGIAGSHLAGDFFLGVDILVTAMLVNFILICASVLTLPRRNPLLAARVTVIPQRRRQLWLSSLGVCVLGFFLVVHTVRDLTGGAAAWYLRSTPVWLLVMALGSLIYWREVRSLRRAGADLTAIFATLPPG